MVIKAIFFDFDGTISDARKIAEDSLILTLDEFGVRYNKKKALKLLGVRMWSILRKLRIANGLLDDIRKRFYRHFTRMAKERKIKLCVSVKPLWKMKKDFSLVVISNSEKSFLDVSIRILKIGGLFDAVYGARKNLRKDEVLKKCFRKMKIKPDEVVYVGDRFSDIEFAKKAGCFAVAIHNKCSWSTLKEIKKERPDYIVKDFIELKRVIREIDKSGKCGDFLRKGRYIK